ncbi:MAG: hypothetical protein R2873_28250 [Caldilineaceae bacterium]
MDGVNFELHNNEALVILANRKGKTSLAKSIQVPAANVDSFTGKVWLNGMDVMVTDDENFRQQIREGLMVPQAMNARLQSGVARGRSVAEPLVSHLGVRKSDAIERFQRGIPPRACQTSSTATPSS